MLTPQEQERYARQIMMPEIGETGQERLKNSRVLVIGAGGLGNFAIMYGHQRNMPDITYTTVVVLVIIVTVVQLIGNYIAKKNTH